MKEVHWMQNLTFSERSLPVATMTLGFFLSMSALVTAPANATSCATVSACVFGDNANTKSGTGIGADAGIFGLSEQGDGVDGETTKTGTSTSASSGVAGYDESTSGTYNSGVFGYSKLGSGVHGSTGSGIGVYGNAVGGTSSTVGIGVYGKASGSTCCVNDFGVYGVSNSGIGVFGISQSQEAVVGNSYSGVGITGGTTTGYSGMIIQGPIGIVSEASQIGFLAGTLEGTAQIGMWGTGTSEGIVGQSAIKPLNLLNAAGTTVAYVDASGNLFLNGSVQTLATTAGGGKTTAFSAKAAAPTMEDTGTAQLVHGVAQVPLDHQFVNAIDSTASYRVFLTPDGDTNGLYVAAKTSLGFIVRETRGGRSTLSFDYRIVATALGDSGKRIGTLNVAASPTLRVPSPPSSLLPTLAKLRSRTQ